MDNETIDELVNSLYNRNSPISIEDLNTQIESLEDPFDVLLYINQVQAMVGLEYKEIVQFEEGIGHFLLETQPSYIKKARIAATTDGLTGLQTRAGIETRMRELKGKYSILMIDIDHFKRFNDTYGHHVGDVVLRTVAEIVKYSIRESIGFIGRYGGEEFYSELNGIGKHDAVKVAERIRESIQASAADNVRAYLRDGSYDGIPFNETITVSIGVADEKQANKEPDKVRQLADAALYHAKDGRNRVVGYEPGMKKSQ